MQVGVSNTPTTPEKGKINKPNAPKTVTSAFLWPITIEFKQKLQQKELLKLGVNLHLLLGSIIDESIFFRQS